MSSSGSFSKFAAAVANVQTVRPVVEAEPRKRDRVA
jgi:hypothetical protein